MATYTINASGTNFPSSIVPNDMIILTNTHTGHSGNIRTWTVPFSGTYQIEAWGAQGSAGNGNGGRGARMRGDFTLEQGQRLFLLVGQRGTHGHDSGVAGGAGGGGSFVATGNSVSSSQPLLVAGGGGSTRGGTSRNWSVLNATVDNTGKNGSHGSGGTNGFGGTNVSGGTGAGAGFYGNGSRTTDGRTMSLKTISQAFINGGTGGLLQYNTNSEVVRGGFGGGQAGGWGGAAGGGGYSGGGAGGNFTNSSFGGGGGSFNSGTSQSNSSGSRSGHGVIEITVISLGPSVPRFPNNILVITNPTINGATFSARLEHQGNPHATRHGFEISTNPEFN